MTAVLTEDEGRGNAQDPSTSPYPWLTRIIRATPWKAFFSLTVLYVVAVATLSHLKLLWLDELITLHIARLGGPAAIWHALALGADPNPPIIHILVHLCRSVFGEREFALRLPAMLGYWIGMLSLFTYLRRRVPAEWALAGTVLSMAMAAFDYSFESRSYGIFYGLAMLAFLSWSRSVEETRARSSRTIWLIALIVALSMGISTNYFAALAFLPIAAGELTRTLRRMQLEPEGSTKAVATSIPRSVDLRVWTALLIAASPLLAYLPLINRDIAQFAPHAWNKVSLDQVFDSYTQMVEIVLYPLLALFGLAGLHHYTAARATQRRRAASLPQTVTEETTQVLPRHELVGVFFLMLYPFLGYLMASIRGGMLSPRFVIPVCFGFAIAGTITSYRLSGQHRSSGAVFLVLVLAWFIARESFVGYSYAEQKQCFYKIVDRLPLAFDGLPPSARLAVPDPLMALTFQHYAPAEYVSRMVFPIDFPAVRKFRKDDSPEQNMWALRSMYSLQIVPLATFQATAGKYVILASDWNWLLQDLDHHHYPEHRLPINTRAGAIGGFTPLSHGLPAFYVAEGGAAPLDPVTQGLPSIPFRLKDNLPEAPDLP
jgi:hypothetical protein